MVLSAAGIALLLSLDDKLGLRNQHLPIANTFSTYHLDIGKELVMIWGSRWIYGVVSLQSLSWIFEFLV